MTKLRHQFGLSEGADDQALTGIIIAAPMPCRMRAAASIGTLIDRPQRIDARLDNATAALNNRRVPGESTSPPTRMHTARLRM